MRAALGGNINLERYLDFLIQKGYLASRDGLYECTPNGRTALGAYDSLLERGLVTEENGLSGTDLAMLRELGDGNYKAAVSRKSWQRIKQRLTERGFVAEGGLTADGRQVLELAADLFELAESFHAYPKTP